MPEEPPFPNRLRDAREQKLMTRAALVAVCARFHDEDPHLYGTVSTSSIRDLELGLVRPRPRTAVVLAKAMEMEPIDLFPNGFDDPRRNPAGKTRIDPDRRKGGRPRKPED